MDRDLKAYLSQEFSRNSIPRVDLQLHTKWTDAQNSVAEMYNEAVLNELRYVGFTEHASARSDSWFSRFVADVRSLPKIPCRAFVGAEARIIDDEGNLGASDEILDQCDIVLASVHRFPDGRGGVYSFHDIEREEAEALELHYSLAALDNPRVHVLSHPFGMCYKIFRITPSENSMRVLIEKVAQTNKMFEINAYYHPSPWKLIEWCRRGGAAISLGSDAHKCEEVGGIVKILEGSAYTWSR